jgi:hypothetical protein
MEDFEKLERLLLDKSYRDLSPSEESWLAAQGIGREAFQQQREVLRSMQQHFSSKTLQVPPSDVFRDALALQRQARRSSRRSILLTGAAMLVIGCVLGCWLGVVKESPLLEIRKELPVREIIRDTVFVKQPPQTPAPPQVIYRDRIQRDTVYVPMPIANSASAEELARDVLSVTTVKDLPELSRNARETEALLKVLVQVY